MIRECFKVHEEKTFMVGPALNSGFRSRMRLGVSLSPLDDMLVHGRLPATFSKISTDS